MSLDLNYFSFAKEIVVLTQLVVFSWIPNRLFFLLQQQITILGNIKAVFLIKS